MKQNGRYRGFDSPLKYFQAHPEKYQGLNRFELSKFDSGLYRTLLRRNQLHIAIPETNEAYVASGRKGGKKSRLRTSESEIEKIIKAHKTFNASANKAAKYLNHAPETIRNYWRSKKLKIRKTGGQPNNFTV